MFGCRNRLSPKRLSECSKFFSGCRYCPRSCSECLRIYTVSQHGSLIFSPILKSKRFYCLDCRRTRAFFGQEILKRANIRKLRSNLAEVFNPVRGGRKEGKKGCKILQNVNKIPRNVIPSEDSKRNQPCKDGRKEGNKRSLKILKNVNKIPQYSVPSDDFEPMVSKVGIDRNFFGIYRNMFWSFFP